MTETYSNPSKSRPETDETPESKYPYNNVIQTPGGIRIVWGDERGKESLKIYHPSGSYMEMFPDGKVSQLVIGENKQYNKGGVTITVDENSDVHISGHQKITVGGGSHVEVQGDAGIVVGGDVAVAGLKNLGLSIKGNAYLGIDGDFNTNVKGNMTTMVQGTHYLGSKGTNTVQSTNLDLNPEDGGNGYRPTGGPQVS